MLYLLNSTDIQDKLRTSPWLKAAKWNGDTGKMVDDIYMRVLSRHAEEKETAAVRKWAAGLRRQGIKTGSREVAEALVWALLNTDEFLFLN